MKSPLLLVGQNDWLQLIVLLVLFIIVLFGAYFATRLFGSFQVKKGTSRNIQQLESISVGPQKVLQLIKVGEEYLLIGITKDRITFMKEIDPGHIDLNHYATDKKNQVLPFNKQLEKFLKKK